MSQDSLSKRWSLLDHVEHGGGGSLSDFSEFDTSSIILENKSRMRPLPLGMAPIVSIETIKIVRPLKVIAFICGCITAFLMVLALATTDWILSKGWRQGLFMHCIDEDAPEPLPFDLEKVPGCHRARSETYIMATAGLCIVTLLLDLLATLLTGLGLGTADAIKKYRYYHLAVYIMMSALLSLLIALVVYPVSLSAELELGNRQLWEFGWAYGVGWGAVIFLFGGVALLLCDKESEELYYKERTILPSKA